ncbi:MAG: tripartite tricarboxylate transporter substrate-binding protein, partial [Treponema sp.]|nr:tripartite tricarboxylate transporter substrate-binding protein [Treponema sp.]
MKRVMVILACVLLIAGMTVAFAGGAGDRGGDIRVIIPSAAGGGNDLTVRALIPGMERALGVSVIPINQTAGAGAVAFHEAATARPDGTTLYFHSKSVLLLQYNAGMENLRIERLAPVAQVAEDVSIFSVRADSPHRTIND